MVRKPKHKKILPPEKIKPHLMSAIRKRSECLFLDIVNENNDVLRSYDMGYAVGVFKEKRRGKTIDRLVIGLIRFNVRTLTVTQMIPIRPEFFVNVIRYLGIAYRECKRIIEEKEREEKKKRLAKFLAKLSPEERELFKEVLRT